MKLKPIIICDEFYLTLMTTLEKGVFLSEIESYFKDPQNLERVAPVWSTGVVYQDSIVILRDTEADVGNDGVGFTLELRAGFMLQIVKLQYETDEISLELYRLEQHCKNTVVTSWFTSLEALEVYADDIENLIASKYENEV